MIRRPPRSTLFPYTTALPILHDTSRIRFHQAHNAFQQNTFAGSTGTYDEVRFSLVKHTADIVQYGPVDRKSTRLNSSHSQISYAVFCLKKKKLNNNNNTI